MKKGDEVTKRVTKENPFSTSRYMVSDGVTKVFKKLLFYIYFFLCLGTFQKTLRHRHFVTFRRNTNV